ncbi:MAG: hypothetical protein OXS35_03235, partial [Dehalococcoidia bacterium]|nr:hypothetical protein [Dehalococcoidia bacterium]
SGRLDEIEGGLSPSEAVAMVLREIKREDGDPEAVRDRVTRSMENHESKEYNRLVERLESGCTAAVAAKITIGEVPHLMQESLMLRLMTIADDSADGMDRQVMLACYDRPVTDSEYAVLLKKARAETETVETWAEYVADRAIDEDEGAGEDDWHLLVNSKERILRDLVEAGKLPGETMEKGELRIPAGALHDWLGDEVIVMDQSGDNPVGEVLPDEASEAARMIRERRERLLSVMREDRKRRERLASARRSLVARLAWETLRIGAELRHYKGIMAEVEREIGEHPATEDERSKLADALADVATVAEDLKLIDQEIGDAVDLSDLTGEEDEESGTFTVTMPAVIVRIMADAKEKVSKAKSPRNEASAAASAGEGATTNSQTSSRPVS